MIPVDTVETVVPLEKLLEHPEHLVQTIKVHENVVYDLRTQEGSRWSVLPASADEGTSSVEIVDEHNVFHLGQNTTLLVTLAGWWHPAHMVCNGLAIGEGTHDPVPRFFEGQSSAPRRLWYLYMGSVSADHGTMSLEGRIWVEGCVVYFSPGLKPYDWNDKTRPLFFLASQ